MVRSRGHPGGEVEGSSGWCGRGVIRVVRSRGDPGDEVEG